MTIKAYFYPLALRYFFLVTHIKYNFFSKIMPYYGEFSMRWYEKKRNVKIMNKVLLFKIENARKEQLKSFTLC